MVNHKVNNGQSQGNIMVNLKISQTSSPVCRYDTSPNYSDTVVLLGILGRGALGRAYKNEGNMCHVMCLESRRYKI